MWTAGLVHPPDDADQLALDADRVVELRRVLIVRRLEADPVLFLVETLERYRVLFHLGDDDVAVVGGVLRRMTT